MNHLLLTTLGALALSSAAAAQCDVYAEDFEAYSQNTLISAIPGWSTAGIIPPAVLVDSGVGGLGSNAIALSGQSGASLASYTIPAGSVPERFQVSFTVRTEGPGQFRLGCPFNPMQAPISRVNMNFDPVAGQVSLVLGSTTLASVAYASASPVSVVAFVDQGGMQRVEVNGTELYIGVFNPGGIFADCTDARRLEFLSTPPGATPTDTFWVDDLCVESAFIGTNYCTAAPNITGVPGVMGANGSTWVGVNSVELTATSVAPNEFGIFIVSDTQAFIPGAGGVSNGNLCLGGAIGRYDQAGQIQPTGPAGEFSLLIDLTALPIGSGPVAVMSGQTWNFQAWHREQIGLGANFTDAIEILFN